MRSEPSDRPTKLIVIATLAALLVALGAFGALSSLGVAAESPSQTADADPTFAVEITDYDDVVTEGDALVVEATVTNEGTTADSQQIHLKNDRNEIVDSEASPALTLEPNESKDVTLEWDTGPGDAEVESVKVVSDHGRDDRTVQIDEASFFTVEGVETDSPVEAGKDLTAMVTVTNDDPDTATQDVWIEVDGDRVADTQVELEPGDSSNETLTWTDTADSAGNWTLEAATTGDRLTTEVTVTEPESSESADGSDESTDSSGDSADDDDGGSGSGWSLPAYVNKRDNGAVDGDGVVELPGNEVAVVDFDREAVSGRLIVHRLRELPEGVTAPNDPVKMYQIDPDGEFADENATVTFAYSNETLDESDLDRVEVLRWNGTAWTALDAEATSAGGEVTVDTETSGFSLFAVTTGGEANVTAGAETTENATAEGEAATNETTDANETADSTDAASEAADADANSTDTDETGAESTDENAASNDSETETTDDTTTDATEASEDETPGFGVVAALLALVVAAGVATRGRQRE
ncbi:MAG: PGF-CTERM sorting domain-containing protein [Methanobacteriota archaeon]